MRPWRRAGFQVSVWFVVAACAAQGSPVPPSPSPSIANPTVTAAPPTSSPVPSIAPLERVALRQGQAGPLGDARYDLLRAAPNGFILGGIDATGARFLAYGSPDGRSWSRFETSPIGDITDIVAGPLGWVLADRDAETGGARLWFSGDGLTWDRLPDQADLGSSIPGRLSAGPMGFALTGFANVSGSSAPATWTSRDGRNWNIIREPADGGVDTVIVLDHEFFGFNSVGISVAWSSADGLDWRQVHAAGTEPADSSGAVLVIPVGDELVVVTASGPDSGLVSFRGRASAPVGSPSFGWEGSTTPTAFAASSVVSAAASAGTRVVLGFDRASLEPRAWRSADGLAWSRNSLATAALGGGVPEFVAAGPSGWVAVGWRADSPGSRGRQPWRSDDGISWQPVDAPLFASTPKESKSPCPVTAPTLVEDYIGSDSALWPSCYGATTLKIRGYIAGCGGCGGETPYLATPRWLIGPMGYFAYYMSPAVVQASQGGTGFGFQVDPAHPIKVPAERTHVEVTGHFDDRASATCRVFPAPGSAADLPPQTLAIEVCRETFVATAVRILGT